jgi:NAD(P)-dependent dehydrogenase (short-subunit alcohol dehydrogenase family)
MDLQLKGKRALVTGGSKGIGKAIARQLAREGVDCAICARTEETLKSTAEELAAETGARIVPVVGNTANAESIQQFVDQAAAQLGGIDILVNCAARPSGEIPEDFERVTDDLILKDFEEKYVGYFRCARAAAPYMRQAGWGRIINIGGLAARNAGPISAGARNASTVHLTKTLAVELGKYGVNVNLVHPSTTVTERYVERMTARARNEGKSFEEVLEQAGTGNSIRHVVTSEEIAYVVAFLASPLAIGINGESIPVTGGAGTGVYY